MHENPETQPIFSEEGDMPVSRSSGMAYRSPTEDNRRTTQQVLIPRRSGIHAVMHPGPRIAVLSGVVIAGVLYLASVIAPQDGDSTTSRDASGLLPTLTVGAAVFTGNAVVVSGTGDSGLYLRAAPHRDAGILATLQDGTVLAVTGPRVTEDGVWLPVRMGDGTTGWVAAAYTREK